MKKVVIVMLISTMLMVTACTANTATTQSVATAASTEKGSTQNTTESGIINTKYDNAVSVEMQLILGTMSLEGTDAAVTKDEANTLVSLWSNLQTMSQPFALGALTNATTTATAQPTSSGTQTTTTNSNHRSQRDELLKQIEAAMTTDQLNAIAAMKITKTSAAELMKKNGMTEAAAQTGSTPQGTPAANSEIGQNPPPDGSSTGGGMNMLPPGMLNSIVQYLAKIAGVTVPTPQANAGTIDDSLISIYSLDAKEETQTGQTFAASQDNKSALFITNKGKMTVSNSTVTSSGNSSNTEGSSLFGLDSAVLINRGGAIDLSGSSITTSGSGSNGLYVTDSNSSATLSSVKINTTGAYSRAVLATTGGEVTLKDVDINTTGDNAGAIATDHGSGTINVEGGKINTFGKEAPGITSSGTVTVKNATITAQTADIAVIDRANSITLTDSILVSNGEGNYGVLIYQSSPMNSDETKAALFKMTGGSLSNATGGALFYVTNTSAEIDLSNVKLTAGSGVLLKATADTWGTSGDNGGNVVLTGDAQQLAGNVVADALSTVKIVLQNGANLNGSLDSSHTAKQMELSLDAASVWSVSEDSYLSCLADASGISGTSITNIQGNNHTVYYKSDTCTALNGQTYTLNGGGTLQPVK